MTSLRLKLKGFKVEGSNVEKIGFREDRDFIEAVTETEKAWRGAGRRPGLEIWRVEQFEVKHWPKEDYGDFYKEEIYIILNTYKLEGELAYDLHFWLGKESTQDEMGTAAYKSYELSTLLDDKPVQYREVQDNESQKFQLLFKSYKGITYLEGGVDSEFAHVKCKDVMPPPRLFYLCGLKESDIRFNGIRRPTWNDFHNQMAFVIVVEKSIIRYFGSESNKHERLKATLGVSKFKCKRHKYESTDIILDDEDITQMIELYRRITSKTDEDDVVQYDEHGHEHEHDDHEQNEEELSYDDIQKLKIYELLKKVFNNEDPPDDYDIKNGLPIDKKKKNPCEEGFVSKLIRVEHGGHKYKVDFTVVAEGDSISEFEDIDEEHVYILDEGKEVISFAGTNCTKEDRKDQMPYSFNYLSDKSYKNAPLSTMNDLNKFKNTLNKKCCR